MQKVQSRGQKAALGNTSVHGHLIGEETIDSDLDAAPSEKANDPFA